MHLRYRFLLLQLLLAAFAANAQVALTVTVTDPKKAPVPYATVRVIALADSTQVQQGVTDSSGTARLQLAATGAYRVLASSASYIAAEKGLRIAASPARFTIVLEPSGTLGAVVVTATRPVMRQEDDKTIVEPENLAASSTNAYEIIEKTPGIFMDQDGNIYLNSTTPATVYINGREQKMSTADIATLLKNLPPNSIARLEILRTPSARYDASGGGGIVNVVLRKGVKPGLTGSVNAVMSQGRYGTQSVGLSLNNNNGRTTSYLNLNYGHRDGFEELRSQRFFVADSVLRQESFARYPANNAYMGFGVSFPAGRRWELSYDSRITLNRNSNNSSNQSTIAAAATGARSSENTALVSNSTGYLNINQGVSAKYKIDSAGSEWSTDVSVNWAPNKNNQNLQTVFQLPVTGSFLQEGLIENNLRFFAAQSNLVKKLARKLTLEGGLKATTVAFRNSTIYRSERVYRYNENINAAYAQASKGFGSGFVLKTGLRVENTNMSGRQLLPNDTSFALHRTDLFPYVYLSRDIMKIMGYQLRAYLVYRRTISRPAYEYLNPAPRVVDPYLEESGNPALRPQFTQNYEANVSVDERPILAVGVNQTRDIFTQVVYQSDSSRKQVAFRTYDNLGNNKELYFRALGAIPGKKVFVVAGVQYNENYYQGLYEGKPLSFRRGTWMLFTYQTYKVTPLTQITINGFMRMRGQAQFYELSTFGALNMSVTQQLFKKKLALTVSGNDLFYTNRNEFELKQGSVAASGERRSDTRRFVLSLRYQFGFRKKEDSNPLNVEAPQ
ncbi:TonB-dependent receptor [Flaviaesturariibacter flavus]|uniref:TonB-dependent receptor n=1 Tax=Flaviaesturariibacter flavus TaxID=2502780 RepID=A0A4R1B7U6_9BACT|nr:outer membrane beta-barrel protein [Flaviaesturariibacter flavus]TCJ12435.1 TonB-dependent receptor [Flaviaesturariibacter flavus]